MSTMDPIQAEIDALMRPPGSGQELEVKFIRGQDGQFAGAQIGDKTLLLTRGPDGTINGLRVADGQQQQPQQQIEMPQAPNQPPQAALPSQFSGLL